MAIARTTAAQWYRRRKVEQSLDEVSEPAECHPGTLVEHLAVRSAVAKLPESYREIIILRYTNQLDLKEIGAVTGLSPNAVGARLHRARQALRDALGPTYRQEVCQDEL